MSFFPRLLAAPRQEDQPGPGHPDRHLVRHLRHELPEPVPGPERVRLLRLQGHRRRGGRLRVVRQHHQERAPRQQHRIKTLILPFFHKRSLTCVSFCRNSTMLTPPASAPVPERKHLKPLSVSLDALYAPFSLIKTTGCFTAGKEIGGQGFTETLTRPVGSAIYCQIMCFRTDKCNFSTLKE